MFLHGWFYFVDLKKALSIEKARVPDGYSLLVEGEKVAVSGAIMFEPYHEEWSACMGNSAGKLINAQGYVTGVVHRGWKFANPIE